MIQFYLMIIDILTYYLLLTVRPFEIELEKAVWARVANTPPVLLTLAAARLPSCLPQDAANSGSCVLMRHVPYATKMPSGAGLIAIIGSPQMRR